LFEPRPVRPRGRRPDHQRPHAALAALALPRGPSRRTALELLNELGRRHGPGSTSDTTSTPE